MATVDCNKLRKTVASCSKLPIEFGFVDAIHRMLFAQRAATRLGEAMVLIAGKDVQRSAMGLQLLWSRECPVIGPNRAGNRERIWSRWFYRNAQHEVASFCRKRCDDSTLTPKATFASRFPMCTPAKKYPVLNRSQMVSNFAWPTSGRV